MQLRNRPSLTPLQTESFLNIAVTDWLAGTSPAPVNRFELLQLATGLRVNHGDLWLTDFLKAPRSLPADTLLMEAVRANHSGNPQQARHDALAAKKIYLRIGNTAGAARSEFEVVYALHRLSKSTECLQQLPVLPSLPGNASYPWLRIQLLLELSTCQGMAAQFDSAYQAAMIAERTANDSRYAILQLRAVGFRAAFNRINGNLPESWRENLAGLALFWEGDYPADREVQFYSELEVTAEEEEQWNTAALLQREVVHTVTESQRPDIAAIAHFRMAQAAEAAGDLQEFEQELNTAYLMFSRLPKNSAIEFYRSYCEMTLATVEARHGNVQSATTRLKQISSSIPDNSIVRLGYMNAWAQVARATNDPNEERYLHEVVAIGNAGFRGLHLEQERWEWHRVIEEACLRMLELETRHPHDPIKALADWESYRAAQVQGRAANVLFSDEGNPTGLLLSRLQNLRNSTLVSFAVLPGSISAWVADDRGVYEYQLPASPGLLQTQVRDFARLCANPASPVEKVRKAGALVYAQLFSLLRPHLSSERTLLVETPNWLGNIPLPALVMEDGRYLDEVFAVINTPGLFYMDNPSSPQRTGRVLLAYPAAVDFHGEHYPALQHAEEEIAALSRLYPKAVRLEGKNANMQRVLRELPQASIFHFAGHAVSRGSGGELLLHGEGAENQITATMLRVTSMPRLGLVVLSACSTASTEDDAARDPNGLVRAFMSSGAETVIASHWDVDSMATAELMNNFYRTFSEKAAPAMALRVARESVRKTPGTSHPYYWSAFDVFSITN
jgi:CHAT domain-containing protein